MRIVLILWHEAGVQGAGRDRLAVASGHQQTSGQGGGRGHTVGTLSVCSSLRRTQRRSG